MLTTLLDAGVTVGIAPGDAWQARNTRFEAAWAALEVGEERAVELVSANLDDLLGVWDGIAEEQRTCEWVAYEGGGVLDLASKPIAVVSPEKGVVDLF